MPLFETKGITKYFGGLCALENVSLSMRKGEIVGLIGPNGAGKTTLFNVISGFYQPSKGRVLFNGQDITNMKPHQVASKGLIRTFQSTTLFSNLSVEDNIVVGCHLHAQISFFDWLFGGSSAQRKEQNVRYRVEEILGLFALTSVKGELARDLPHGYQRALGAAVALAAEPKLLMLDEPFTGMSTKETITIMSQIKKIHQEKEVTIFIIEHSMRAIMGLCDRIVVLNFGNKIAEGTPDEIQANQAVIRAYLGEETEDVT